MVTSLYAACVIAQTVFFPDVLDGGVSLLTPVSWLMEPLTATGTKLFITKLSALLVEGAVIQIGEEKMLITSVDSTPTSTGISTVLNVQRGHRFTKNSAYATVTGGAECSCDLATGNATGGTSCSCTTINWVRVGATRPKPDVGVEVGQTGDPSAGCRLGAPAGEGCNPLKYTYSNNLRTHQSVNIIEAVTPSIMSVSGNATFSARYAMSWLNFFGAGKINLPSDCAACGYHIGYQASSCTFNCICPYSSMVSGSEFLNLQQGSKVSIASPGDPLAYPVDYRTYLEEALPDSEGSSNIVVHSTASLVGKYIRIDDEVLFVKSQVKGLGVKNVGTFKASTASCTCSLTGVASSGCSCSGAVLSGCTSGGTLVATGGGGFGFAATFTVSGGRINSIVVSSPGSYSSAPKIVVGSGGDGCVNLHNYTFYPTMSGNVLGVIRASLGTSKVAHAAYSKVNTVLWPSQKNSPTGWYTPGKRYEFRIAAFNSAGLSEFLYYDIKLREVFPRKLTAKGSVLVEIILVGAGTSESNYTVYIGHTNEKQEIDYSRSKVCTGLRVLDNAGTKITCRSPAWVGKQHDLIVHYKSGIFEHFAVGRSWMTYEPPTIVGVTPAQVDAGETVNVTITGTNFGFNASDVSGHLEGASVLPCTPLTLIGDAQAICTLVPKVVCNVFGHLAIYPRCCLDIICDCVCVCVCD